MTLRSIRNLCLCFLVLATALPAFADIPQPGVVQELYPPTTLEEGLNPAGKGTIGIVCHGADGNVRALQPVSPIDVQEEGSSALLRKIRGQLLDQFPLDEAQEMTCGYEKLNFQQILDYTQFGPVLPLEY